MTIKTHPILLTTLILGLFALIGTTLVASTHQITKEKIKQNEYETLLKTLNSLIPSSSYDNQLIKDSVILKQNNGSDMTIYRARHNEQAIAAIINTSTKEGYNGLIQLIIGIHLDGSLAGVRILNHKETPGLGDAIEIRKSNCLTQFERKSLRQPKNIQWAVKKDGGTFDSITSATITSRAVIKSIKQTLEYFLAHKSEIFEVKK